MSRWLFVAPVHPVDAGSVQVAVDGGAQGGEESVVAESIVEFVAAEPVLDGPFSSAKTSCVPSTSRSSSSWASISAAVVSISVMGSAARMTQRIGSSRRAIAVFNPLEKNSALAKNSGASKR